MGLLPLEFSECLTDSPQFRDKLHNHEKELDRTSKGIKQLISESKDILNASQSLSKAHRNFAKTLNEFQFECIGNERTDEEVSIEKSLKEFARLINGIEDERDRMHQRAQVGVIEPLDKFRKEQIGDAKEHKKKFERHTARYCQSVDKYLGIRQSKTTETQLIEADNSLETDRQQFYKESMQYVQRLQEVQERKKFEFVEILLQFIYGALTFYHLGYEFSDDFKGSMNDLSLNLQKCRANFELTKEETTALMNKILDKPQEYASKQYTREGYLFMMEKRPLGTTWNKYYCQYQKSDKSLLMTPYNQATAKSSTPTTTSDPVILTSCTRRAQDTIDKRFCFDITISEKNQTLTLQALTEEDRRQWLDAMDGKEPIYQAPPRSNKLDSLLDDVGFSFIQKCISAIEKRGLEDEGLYRIVGVAHRVTNLTKMLLDRKRADKVDLMDVNSEWEMKTITSAVKNYFRSLPEPLMTFALHKQLIQAAKQEVKTLRINDIHELVHQLPESNFEMLKVLIAHLKRVAEYSNKNLMTVMNIGVCFGPTLMRPEEETMAAIMDIKFCNLVIEILIEHYDKIFETAPQFADITKTRVLPSATKGRAPLPPTPSAVPPTPNGASITSVGPFDPSSSPVTPQRKDSDLSKSVVGGLYPSLAPASVMTTSMPSPLNQSDVSKGEHARKMSGGGGSDVGQTYAQHRTNLRPTTVYGVPSGHQSPANLNSASPATASLSSNTMSSSGVAHIVSDEQSNASSSSDSLNFKSSNSSMSTSTSHRPNLSSSTTSSSTGRRVRTLFACEAENESELSFEPNQIITNVRQSKEPGWLEGMLDGRVGLIPHNYVEFLT